MQYRILFRPVCYVGIMLFSFLGMLQAAHAEQIQNEKADVGFNEATLLAETELASQSGQGLKYSALSNAQLSGNVINLGAGATLNNGNNTLSNHALDNFNGIATVVQNSGNNVVIQSSTIVNLAFE